MDTKGIKIFILGFVIFLVGFISFYFSSIKNVFDLKEFLLLFAAASALLSLIMPTIGKLIDGYYKKGK